MALKLIYFARLIIEAGCIYLCFRITIWALQVEGSFNLVAIPVGIFFGFVFISGLVHLPLEFFRFLAIFFSSDPKEAANNLYRQKQ